MKKIIFIIIVICSLTKVNAQPYQSIFSKHTSFNVLITLNGGDAPIYTDSIFVYGDTIINSLIYQKFTNWGLETPFHPYWETETFYIREDTTNGKVYGIDINLNKEILLMDMSLSVGNTFVFQKLNDVTGDSLALVVDSVVYVNGKKNIIFKGNQSMGILLSILKMKFIEGVGPTNSLFAFQRSKVYGIWMGQYCAGLLCHHDDNGMVQYAQPYYDCSFYGGGGVNELDADIKFKISISPNPANSSISVSFPVINESMQLQFYNILGEIVLDRTLNKNISQAIIETNNLKNGFYKVILKVKGEIKGQNSLIISN
ncbi:MAG: T9SS type A sorting domain-containing protein [Bacteroidales bacterium]